VSGVARPEPTTSAAGEEIIKERLSGLGYIS
jgi:hypothetical protein